MGKIFVKNEISVVSGASTKNGTLVDPVVHPCVGPFHEDGVQVPCRSQCRTWQHRLRGDFSRTWVAVQCLKLSGFHAMPLQTNIFKICLMGQTRCKKASRMQWLFFMLDVLREANKNTSNKHNSKTSKKILSFCIFFVSCFLIQIKYGFGSPVLLTLLHYLSEVPKLCVMTMVMIHIDESPDRFHMKSMKYKHQCFGQESERQVLQIRIQVLQSSM